MRTTLFTITPRNSVKVNTVTLCIAHLFAWSLNRLVAVVHVDNGFRNNLSSSELFGPVLL